MIMSQAMRRSGYDDDPGWLRLAGRIAQETSPVAIYWLRPEEIEKRFPSAGQRTAEEGGQVRGVKSEPGLRTQAQQMFDEGMPRAAIAKQLKIPLGTLYSWLPKASRASNGKTAAIQPAATADRKANGVAHDHPATGAPAMGRHPDVALAGEVRGDGGCVLAVPGAGAEGAPAVGDSLRPMPPTERPASPLNTQMLTRAQALDLHGLALQTLVLVAPSPELEQMPSVQLARQVAALCRRVILGEACGE